MIRPAPAAAIVCGTHTAGLLVVASDGAPIHRESRVIRLGEGLAATGRLTPPAIARTAAALVEFRATLDRLGAGAVRVAATSAARFAGNREELLWAAERAVGVRPEVLSGDEEARLSFRSATAGLDAGPRGMLVVDIGGGSTELAVGPAAGRRSEPEAVRSVPVGCVAIARALMRADPPTCRALGRAASVLARRVARIVEETPALGDAATLVLLAGATAGAADVRSFASAFARRAATPTASRRSRPTSWSAAR